MSKIIIYTDWSCLWNPWIGWRACLLKFKNKEKIICWWKKQATNNIMELMAVIKAFEQINTDKYLIEIWTDSKYVLDGINSWIKKWKQNGRQTSQKKDVKNKKLWQNLDEYINKYNIKIYWVKWHWTNKYNNLVDEIARNEAEKIKYLKY